MKYSIGSFSEINLHPDYRWDSEYLCFRPYKNRDIKYVPIGEIIKSSQYGLSIKMNEERNGTKIYRMNEISNMMCNRTIFKYAPISHDDIKKYDLNDGDVLFNRTNSQKFVGRTGIFRKYSKENMVFASYLIRIIPDTEIVTSEYLTTFLNTKYGIIDIKRRARISINQSNVNAEELKKVEIPLFSCELQTQVKKAFDVAFKLIQKSEARFSQAQDILLSELGLLSWHARRRLSFIKHYSDTKQAGRIDAEYFQPKYEEIIHAIQRYAGGWDMLGNLVTMKDRNFNPENNKNYQYIELANIASNGEIADCMLEDGESLPTRARRLVSAGDVIVSSIEGSLSSIALIEKEYDQALCSTGFHVIRSKKFNSETLLVLLKSIVGQLQLKKGCGGTILTAINKDEFIKMALPIIVEAKQLEIQQKLRKSFELRKESKNLLECAKQAVEIAIEQDEQTATRWLEKEIADVQ